MTTAPRTLAKLAARCVAGCFSDSSKDLVFSDKESTAAASALTSIITAAQCAEHFVEASPLMGKLQACVIVKTTQPDGKTNQMVLWNSIQDIRGVLHRGATELLDETVERSNEIHRETSPETQRNATATLQPTNSTQNSRANVQTPVAAQGSSIRTPVPSSLDTTRPAPCIQSPLVIPSNIAEEIALKILAGSGYFTHNSNPVPKWPDCYTELYCKHVTFVLQRIYETEKIISENPYLRYENLIPDHLLLKPVTIYGLSECTRQKKGSIPNKEVFILDISNRKSTQKHVAFAAICIAYERRSENNERINAARAVLEKFRKEGESEIACIRYRERGSKIKVAVCTRRAEGSCLQSRCAQEPEWHVNHISLLNDNGRIEEAMALGTIDLTLDKVGDVALSKDSLAITITHSLNLSTGISKDNAHSQSHPIVDESVSPITRAAIGIKVAWRKGNLPRVNILFNFKRRIGDAILVSYRVSQSTSESPMQAGEQEDNLPVVASYEATDPSKAAVICDLKLSLQRKDLANLRYPYAEWYSMTPFCGLAAQHFRTASRSPAVPKMISELPKGKGILWHRDWISSPAENMFTSLNEANERSASND